MSGIVLGARHISFLVSGLIRSNGQQSRHYGTRLLCLTEHGLSANLAQSRRALCRSGCWFCVASRCSCSFYPSCCCCCCCCCHHCHRCRCCCCCIRAGVEDSVAITDRAVHTLSQRPTLQSTRRLIHFQADASFSSSWQISPVAFCPSLIRLIDTPSVYQSLTDPVGRLRQSLSVHH